MGKHINPKFAERFNVPQKPVEWHLGRSANFGLGSLMGV